MYVSVLGQDTLIYLLTIFEHKKRMALKSYIRILFWLVLIFCYNIFIKSDELIKLGGEI